MLPISDAMLDPIFPARINATIVELNEHTLTAAGKEAWADILDAEVVKVYNGYYGLQMELDKVKLDLPVVDVDDEVVSKEVEDMKRHYG